MNELLTKYQSQLVRVMQPRVRRTLGIESPVTFILPNPNTVPSGSTVLTTRVSVLECSSRALKPSTVIDSRASIVAISLRELSRAHGKLTSSRTSTVVHGGESHSRISTEQDGYFASPDRRWQIFDHAVDTLESAGGPAHSRTLPRAIEPTLP